MLKIIWQKFIKPQPTKVGYIVFIFFFSFWFFYVYNDIKSANNTSGIVISSNYTKIHCGNDVQIIPSKNAYTYYREGVLKFNNSLQDDICTIDRAFDKSDRDRIILFDYADTKLEFWMSDRLDIAQYLYRKIIDTNPNDALSLYIKEEKLRNKKLQHTRSYNAD